MNPGDVTLKTVGAFCRCLRNKLGDWQLQMSQTGYPDPCRAKYSRRAAPAWIDLIGMQIHQAKQEDIA